MNKFAVFTILVALTLSTSACEDAASSTESQTLDVKIAGWWAPPSHLVKKADAFDITYTGAGNWVGEEGCGGAFLDGTKAIKEWTVENYFYVGQVGGYSCRHINGNPNLMSVHATGRALDIHIPLDDGEADNDLGDPIANYLLEHADKMGIQLIIWDNWVWSAGRSAGNRSYLYTGAHKHHDHIHMELSLKGAAKMESWFSNPIPPEGVECSADTISADKDSTIDNKSPCFQMAGNQDFWRTEPKGFDGDLRWTNATKKDTPANWARWMMNFEKAGKYKVFYYSVPEFAVFNSTRYLVRHNEKSEEIFIDQSAPKEEGWQEIGTYDFAEGAGQWVGIYDNTPADVEADQHIIADAIRIVPVDVPTNNSTMNPNNTNSNNTNSNNTNPNSTNPNNKPGSNNTNTTPGEPNQPIDSGIDDSDDIVVSEGCTVSAGNSANLPLFLLAAVFFFRRKKRN